MSTHCSPRIDAAGLPGRTPIMVARDERRYPLFADTVVAGALMLREPSDVELEHDVLLTRLGEAPRDARHAAWIAGRCTTGDASADGRTVEALEALVERIDPAQLGLAATPYVEALLSLALLGQADRAEPLLEALVADPGKPGTAGYLAASHLAQLGNPAGYPLLHGRLHQNADPHGRMLATREIVAFLPFDGQQVDGLTVDVRGELVARLTDKDNDVSVEVPELLAETDLPGIRADIEQATGRGVKKPVREAAKFVLAALDER